MISEEKRSLLETTAPTPVNPIRSSRLWRNACVVNLSAVLFYSGTTGLNSIQSSLNSDQGLGVAGMAVTAVVSLFGSLLSGVVIGVLGCKWTMVWSLLLSSICYVSNYYPTWSTVIPASIVNGLVIGLLVVTQRVYTAQLGHLHSDVEDIGTNWETEVNGNNSLKGDPRRSRTQGIFFLFYVASYKLGYVTGNLGSSLILGIGIDDASSTITPADNATSMWFNYSSPAPVQQCGAAFCNEDLKSDFHDIQDRTRIYILIGLFVGLNLLSAVLVSMFLDDLDFMAARQKTVRPSFASVWMTFKATLALHKNPFLLLLVPFSFSLMAFDAFWMADFSKAFITCPLGMQSIGYVMMWMGVTATVASGVFGWMTSRHLRLGPLILAHLLQGGIVIGLLYWLPDKNSLMFLCVFTAACYLGAGVRHSIFPALVGIVFRDKLELAFSNIQMWGALGSVMILVFSSWLCMDAKLYVIIALLGFSFITYMALELLLEVDMRRSHCDD